MLSVIKLSVFSVAFSCLAFTIVSLFNFFSINHFILLIFGLKWLVVTALMFIFAKNINHILSFEKKFQAKEISKQSGVLVSDVNFYNSELFSQNIEITGNIQQVRKHKRYFPSQKANSCFKVEFIKNKQFVSYDAILENVSKHGVYLVSKHRLLGKERDFSLRISNDIPSQKLELIRSDELGKNTFGYAFKFSEPFDLERQKESWDFIKTNIIDVN